MCEENTVVRIYNSPTESETNDNDLKWSGFDMSKLSIVGKDYHHGDLVVGNYNLGDRIKVRGTCGTFWRKMWSYIVCIHLLLIFSTAAIADEAPIDLGSAADFAILAYSTVTNVVSVGTVITGDIGVSPNAAVTGFPPGIVIGAIHAADPISAQAQADLTIAYNDAAGRSTAPIGVSGNLGGMTLYPGLYKSTSSLEVSSGDLTLDAQGNPNAVFIFQMASTLTTTIGRQVILAGGAQASNIFWQVGSSATIGVGSVFSGTIMADISITFYTGATLVGRALARNGAVTLDSNTIDIPREAPTNTETPTETGTETPTETGTETPTETGTLTAVDTETGMPTPTVTLTPTDTSLETPTETSTVSTTATQTKTGVTTPTASATRTASNTKTGTRTPTVTATLTATPTPGCDSGLYMLLTTGQIERIGHPPVIVGGFSYSNDFARDLERATANNGIPPTEDLVVLDGSGVASFVENSGDNIAQDFLFEPTTDFPIGRAVDLEMSQSGEGFWVLTDFGGIYRAGDTKEATETALVMGTNQLPLGYDVPYGDLRQPWLANPGGASLRGVALVVIDINAPLNMADGYIIIDSQGARYQFTPDAGPVVAGTYSALPVNDPLKLLEPQVPAGTTEPFDYTNSGYLWPFYPGQDIARDAEIFPGSQKGLVVFDGYGGIHPVPVDVTTNPVFYTRNEDPANPGTPITTVGMPYLVYGFDDPETAEDESDSTTYGIDAYSIFTDLDFSAGCPDGGFYTLDKFGGVYVFGSARIAPDNLHPAWNLPFVSNQNVIDMELYGYDEKGD